MHAYNVHLLSLPCQGQRTASSRLKLALLLTEWPLPTFEDHCAVIPIAYRIRQVRYAKQTTSDEGGPTEETNKRYTHIDITTRSDR